MDAVQNLMDKLWKVSGAPAAIMDIDGTILVATGWQDICTQFHRRHPETNTRCLESDAYLAKHLDEYLDLPECGYLEYRCQNGLIDIGIPIVIEGGHLANFFLGQFFYEPPDEEFFADRLESSGLMRPPTWRP